MISIALFEPQIPPNTGEYHGKWTGDLKGKTGDMKRKTGGTEMGTVLDNFVTPSFAIINLKPFDNSE